MSVHLLVCLLGTQNGAAVIQNGDTPGQDSLCTVSKTDPAVHGETKNSFRCSGFSQRRKRAGHSSKFMLIALIFRQREC